MIAGLLLWGLPGVFVAGPQAILYAITTSLPVWWFCIRGASPPSVVPIRRLSTATCVVLASFTSLYLIWDALFGRQLLQTNMFLLHGAAVAQQIEGINEGMSKGGGIADLLGYIFLLLPFALIDATRRTSRYGRWILWTIAAVFLFYETGSGRGFVLMAVMAIVLGSTTDWRRILMGAGFGLGAFTVASAFRGDSADGQSPLLIGIMWPFINLGLMLNGHCGSAPWYSFLLEFLKKFLPAFLIPKTIFSFNMEMTLCLSVTGDNSVDAVSVFTWLGEIFYYKPSFLTALIAGVLLGVLIRAVDRLLVKYQMYSARLFAGLMCVLFPRSRSQDTFTFLIAQLILLIFFLPHLFNLTRTLNRLLFSESSSRIEPEPRRELL